QQMTSQIAAAIRLYRPRVVATGYYADGYRGKPAEIAFVARCTETAVELAAKKDAMQNFAQLNLPPHKVERLFKGCESNENTSTPWNAKSFGIDVKKYPFIIDTTRVVDGQNSPISYRSAFSAWLTGGGFLDRPAPKIAYNSRDVQKRKVLLMTQGLTPRRLKLCRLNTDDSLLANGGLITFADGEGRLPVIMNELVGIFDEKDDGSGFDRKLLAADNMAMILYRLAAVGKLIPAVQAMQSFLEYGQMHPMYEMLRVSSIATLSSSEFRGQMAMVQLDEVPQINRDFISQELPKLMKVSPWLTQPQGLAMAASLYRKIDQPGQSDHITKKMLDANFSPSWDSFVRTERAIRAGKIPESVGNRKILKPEVIRGKMEIDGLLDDEAWQNATPLIMTGNDETHEELVGHAMLARNKTELVVALRLPNATARNWNVTLAIDSDRDAWVQEIIRFNSLGESSAQTVPFAGPAWTIDKRNILLKKYVASTSDEQTFELVFPLKHFDAEIDSRDYWGFQIIAVADGPDGKTAIYLQPQDSPQLLPHRYGLLDVRPQKINDK
ncbi:MAG TPA: hypothetical protein PKK48_08750, partial [Phycisphaerae bacterium]|nr:hypothetical protein [Phycisphaerae bacterium]